MVFRLSAVAVALVLLAGCGESVGSDVPNYGQDGSYVSSRKPGLEKKLCRNVDCGEGTCFVEAGLPRCACDAGFVADGLSCAPVVSGCGDGTCEADESCATCEPPAPVLDSVEVQGGEFRLTWSQPDSPYGAPDGGYDILVDGVDSGDYRTTDLTITIRGLPTGTHVFQVEARFTEVSAFPRSAEVSATSQGPVDPPLDYLPVFPGAQGFGSDTIAGRGGRIIAVTNLQDSGTGSLRAALAATGPRTVVFEVSGTITLASTLKIVEPFVTIAGQTAPSPGISLKGRTLEVATHDVLIQHIRQRLGYFGDTKADGIRLNGGQNPVYNVVVDHVSIAWGVDENFSTYRDVRDVTISNSILSEALTANSSYALLVMDGTQRIAVVKNLFAHNRGRHPLLKGDTSSVVLNNVMYNGGLHGRWTQIGMNYSLLPSYLSAVGNAYLAGPNTPSGGYAVTVRDSCVDGTQVFTDDNLYPGGGQTRNDGAFDPWVSVAPVWHDSLSAQSVAGLEPEVLASAGARPLDRDSVDARIVAEVGSKAGSWVATPEEAGGWPSLATNTRAFQAPADPQGDADGDGYTNLEELLHQMARELEP